MVARPRASVFRMPVDTVELYGEAGVRNHDVKLAASEDASVGSPQQVTGNQSSDDFGQIVLSLGGQQVITMRATGSFSRPGALVNMAAPYVIGRRAALPFNDRFRPRRQRDRQSRVHQLGSDIGICGRKIVEARHNDFVVADSTGDPGAVTWGRTVRMCRMFLAEPLDGLTGAVDDSSPICRIDQMLGEFRMRSCQVIDSRHNNSVRADGATARPGCSSVGDAGGVHVIGSVQGAPPLHHSVRPGGQLGGKCRFHQFGHQVGMRVGQIVVTDDHLPAATKWASGVLLGPIAHHCFPRVPLIADPCGSGIRPSADRGAYLRIQQLRSKVRVGGGQVIAPGQHSMARAVGAPHSGDDSSNFLRERGVRVSGADPLSDVSRPRREPFGDGRIRQPCSDLRMTSTQRTPHGIRIRHMFTVISASGAAARRRIGEESRWV